MKNMINAVKHAYLSKKEKLAIAGTGLLAAAGSASAAVDTTAITTALTDAGAAVAVVGGAVVVAYVGVKVFHLVRSAL
ncbi:major capsid protein [Collimonas antrihumi]|uniref:major capsid protein n=1 Tax=Collimonas antrihumi TaxID=1940615 RepID=UPI001FE25269|nr:major capsid protein [Collimonas antrihumi]